MFHAFFVEQEMHLDASFDPSGGGGWPLRSRVSSSPVADNYLKGGGGGGGRPKNREANETGRNEENEGTKAWRWEVSRGGKGGQKAKRGVFWLAAKNRREQPEKRRRSVRVCVRERERDKKEEREREKKRKKKRRGKKEEKKKRKRRKRKRSTHHHPLGWTRRMRAIPWRSIRLSYPSLFPLDFLPIY